jgi:LysM repeat protein
MIAGDTAPARALFTPTASRAQQVEARPTVQAVLVVTATPVPAHTLPPVVILSPTSTTAVAPARTATAVVAQTAPPTAPAPARSGSAYTVQQGDSLSALSRRFAVPVTDLARVNGLAPDAGLRTGERLTLPAGIWSDRLAIRAIQPEAGARLRAPIVVRGTAATFEGLVMVEALDAGGTRLVQVSAKAASPDAGLHGPFEATLAVPASASDQSVTIRLYWPSPRDGSPSDEIRIPVTVVG